jgi:hypothetical protein
MSYGPVAVEARPPEERPLAVRAARWHATTFRREVTKLRTWRLTGPNVTDDDRRAADTLDLGPLKDEE